MPEQTIPTELEQIESTDPMLREVNRGLMVHWINRDLVNNAWADVETSIVLYDEARFFVAALPPVMGPVPNEGLTKKLLSVGVRFYSTGIV